MLTRFALTVAIVLVAAYGVAEALWSERWFPTAALRQAKERFDAIPRTIGPWVGEDRELDDRQAQVGEIKASLVRHYTNTETGASVNVLLVAGRSGPICVHTPEVCLGGGGWALTAPATRAKVEAAGGTADFWHATFRKGAATVPEDMEVYWAWNPGAGWQAARSPRLEFLRQRALFKVYVSRSVSGLASREGEESPIPGFLQGFLPEVERAVFAAQ
jgi:hypothetical protein